tara:strand:- start:1039 stop:2748 length:1710 start_codon:yes stop_codon:yes gene_type:complete
MSKNINTNTAIANIILSKDHEIRLKKKPKKKSNNKKKEALDAVKEALRNYDLSVAEAKSKNISLPAELGVLPVNIEDVNSVKELQELAVKLQNMTNQINQLIAQGQSQSRVIGLFQEGMIGQRQGVIPQAIQPRIINQERIPQERPIEIKPIQPIVPSEKPIDTSKIPDDSAEKTLEEIRKEILDKLSPEDKAKAEQQMEDERNQPAPAEPADLTPPTTPRQTPQIPDLKPAEKINPSDLETNLNIPFGSQTISRLVSPKGFYNIFTDYRRYIKDVAFRTKKIVEDEFKITKDDETILKDEKDRILNNYDSWLQSLNKLQVQYIDSDPQMQNVNNEMLKELNLDIEQLAQELLKGQGINIKSFEVGDTEVPIEEKAEERISEKGKAFEIELKQIKTEIEEQIKKSSKTLKPKKLQKIIDNLNLIKVKIDKYNNLNAIDKVALEVLHSDISDEFNQAEKIVQDKLVEVSQGLPSADLPKPKPKIDKIDPNVRILNEYVNTIGNYSSKVREALVNLDDTQTTLEGANAIQDRNFKKGTRPQDTKNLIKEFLIKKNLYQPIVKQKKPAVDAD